MREETLRKYFWTLNKWLYLRNKGIFLRDHQLLKSQTLAVYGIGNLGKRLIEELLMDDRGIAFAVDKKGDDMYADFDIYNGSTCLPPADVLIVSMIGEFDEIKTNMDKVFDGEIVSLESIVDDLWRREWEKL